MEVINVIDEVISDPGSSRSCFTAEEVLALWIVIHGSGPSSWQPQSDAYGKRHSNCHISTVYAIHALEYPVPPKFMMTKAPNRKLFIIM